MRNASPGGPPAKTSGHPEEGTVRNASEETSRTELVCACCRRTVTTAIAGLFYNPPVGSPQRFCSPSCRVAAWARRRAGVPEATPLQWRGGRSRRLRPEGTATQGELPRRALAPEAKAPRPPERDREVRLCPSPKPSG